MISVRYCYGWSRGDRRYELWAVMKDGVHVEPVRINYHMDWWRREGSVSDLKAMAMQKAKGEAE